MKNMNTRKGMNPALAAMSARQKDNTLILAAYKANMIATLMVLHDKYGFGTVRLERFIDEHKKLLDAYNAGYLDVKDIENTLEEETGIKITL